MFNDNSFVVYNPSFESNGGYHPATHATIEGALLVATALAKEQTEPVYVLRPIRKVVASAPPVEITVL